MVCGKTRRPSSVGTMLDSGFGTIYVSERLVQRLEVYLPREYFSRGPLSDVGRWAHVRGTPKDNNDAGVHTNAVGTSSHQRIFCFDPRDGRYLGVGRKNAAKKTEQWYRAVAKAKALTTGEAGVDATPSPSRNAVTLGGM